MIKVAAIQKTVDKTIITLKKLMKTGLFEDENKAFFTLRAVMKALRDRLTTGEAMDLAAQLPVLLRGFYFEGWNMKNESKSRTKGGFLQDVRNHLKGYDDIELEAATTATLGVILDMIDQGEAIDVLHQLPKDIQELCPDTTYP